MITINDDFWQFVDNNAKSDVNRLRLKYHNSKALSFDINLAITQIECRKRFGKKLSETLEEHRHWLFPSVLAGEQSTSDKLAAYHAALVGDGNSVIDLTSGLGIDILHLSKKASGVTAVEIDDLKAEALKYNFAGTCVTVINDDCREYIRQSRHYDVAFIDPARRAVDGSRVYALSQCQPDVVTLLPQLSEIASLLIVKMSPMLDITQTFRELPNAERIIALGTETECKELIAVVDLNTKLTTDKKIEAVTLKNDGTIATIEYTASDEKAIDLSTHIGNPVEGDYLYDPYPAVMKAAPYRLLVQKYGVKKFSNNTHLYFSRYKTDDFPGQCFIIKKIIPYNSKYIKRLKKEYPRIGVTTRNFDVAADSLRSKLGVNDSDSLRLFAVTLADTSKVMLITEKQK